MMRTRDFAVQPALHRPRETVVEASLSPGRHTVSPATLRPSGLPSTYQASRPWPSADSTNDVCSPSFQTSAPSGGNMICGGTFSRSNRASAEGGRCSPGSFLTQARPRTALRHDARDHVVDLEQHRQRRLAPRHARPRRRVRAADPHHDRMAVPRPRRPRIAEAVGRARLRRDHRRFLRQLRRHPAGRARGRPRECRRSAAPIAPT